MDWTLAWQLFCLGFADHDCTIWGLQQTFCDYLSDKLLSCLPTFSWWKVGNIIENNLDTRELLIIQGRRTYRFDLNSTREIRGEQNNNNCKKLFSPNFSFRFSGGPSEPQNLKNRIFIRELKLHFIPNNLNWSLSPNPGNNCEEQRKFQKKNFTLIFLLGFLGGPSEPQSTWKLKNWQNCIVFLACYVGILTLVSPEAFLLQVWMLCLTISCRLL